MDKLLKLLAALLTMFTMTVYSTSCSDDDAKTDDAKTIVTISVNSNEQPFAGITVYMFKSNIVDSYGLNRLRPMYARKSVVADANGIAVFELDDFDLNLKDSQATLYFVTFTKNTVTGKEESLNYVGITIKEGETKFGTINIGGTATYFSSKRVDDFL
ncbi:MAG: hypothetical protein K6E14_10475 [Paludibacteraceae bacterium]|nr:hypothetical protein [Paludibacteraceae bacterium]